jgi:putative toxin-antitoxin system antitoxin component (TIGR02293 family)
MTSTPFAGSKARKAAPARRGAAAPSPAVGPVPRRPGATPAKKPARTRENAPSYWIKSGPLTHQLSGKPSGKLRGPLAVADALEAAKGEFLRGVELADDPVFERTLLILGGTRALKPLPNSRLEVHDLISRGLPMHSLESLERLFPVITRDHLSAMLGTSLRTLQRKSTDKNASLEPDKSGSLWAVAALLSKAESVLGDRDIAMAWLNRPQMALDNRRPVDLMETTPGRQEVELLLDRLDHGVYI